MATASPTTSAAGSATVAPSSSSSEPPSGTLLLNEDFESYTAGAPPDGYDVFIAWNLANENFSGPQVVAVDAAQKHGGSQAMLFDGGTGGVQIAWDIPEGNTHLYARAWVYFDSHQLGNNPMDSNANHETLIALRGSPENANNEIRFGEIKGRIGTNETPSDDISPPQTEWYSGPEIPIKTWACVEVAFLGDLPYHELHAWVNDELVHSIVAAEDWGNHAVTAPNWMDGKFVQVVFGWHSFSNFEQKVWMDDIAVSTDRIGCD